LERAKGPKSKLRNRRCGGKDWEWVGGAESREGGWGTEGKETECVKKWGREGGVTRGRTKWNGNRVVLRKVEGSEVGAGGGRKEALVMGEAKG